MKQATFPSWTLGQLDMQGAGRKIFSGGFLAGLFMYIARGKQAAMLQETASFNTMRGT
jgi:hypothetical protein